MKHFLSFLLIQLIIASLNSSCTSTTKFHIEANKILADTSKWTIIKYNKQPFLPIDTTSSNTTLSNSEILESLNFLIEAVEKSKIPRIHNLSEYKIQLMPVINPKGEKEVIANCFCTDNFPYWRKNAVFVYDGGSCFFKVSINLTNKTTSKVWPNGVA